MIFPSFVGTVVGGTVKNKISLNLPYKVGESKSFRTPSKLTTPTEIDKKFSVLISSLKLDFCLYFLDATKNNAALILIHKCSIQIRSIMSTF